MKKEYKIFSKNRYKKDGYKKSNNETNIKNVIKKKTEYVSKVVKNNLEKNSFFKKYSSVMVTLLMIVVFVLVLSGSYAFFTTVISGKEFVIYTGTLAVDYTKKTDIINLENLYPMTNTEGLNQTAHEFSVTNNGNITARYQVRLELDNTIKNMIPVEYIKLSYSIDGSNYSEPVLLSDLGSNLVFVKDLILEKTKSNSFGIKLWVDLSAPNDIQGKEFKARVIVDSIQNVEDGYIVDTVPIITLNKDKSGNQDINLKVNDNYTELGVLSVEDDKDIFTVSEVSKTYEYYDGSNLSTVNSIDTSKTGIYYITYSITDSEGNIGRNTRIVTVNNSDTIPSITLNGNSSISLGERDYYYEEGVTVTDNNKVTVIGEVKTAVVGTYVVKYIVVDGNNNLNSVIRTVVVNSSYQELLLNGTDPVLTSNLVPIEIADDGTVTKVSSASTWHDYGSKKWANAVVLKTPTEVIGEDKIHGATINNDYVSLDGVDDYIDLGLAWYDFGQSYSVSINFKINELKYSSILGNWEQCGGGLFYGSNGTITGNVYVKELGKYVVTTVPFTDTENYHNATLTYDGSTVRLYLDGKLVDSEDGAGSVKPAYVRTFLGANPLSDNVSAGQNSNIDVKQYAIYNRTLTEDEISTNMKSDIKITNSTGLLRYGDFSNSFTNGEVIPEDNIESYFVWIPKYSYQLWDLNKNNTTTTEDPTKPHAIPIRFGTTNTSDSVDGECEIPMNDNGTQGLPGTEANLQIGNCEVGDYMTHPAFLTFDSNGFWVGKFETGYNGATSASTAQVDSDDISKIIIKPNVYSWRSTTFGNKFKLSYQYLRENDSHMLKNTEYGAIAYLSHSLYGTCDSDKCNEIRINNNSDIITGYAAVNEATVGYNGGTNIEGNILESTSLGVDGTYTVNYLNSLSNLASTTGNKSGIYDLSGGGWESVMGYTTGVLAEYENSGITDLYSDFFTNQNLEKYYDKYSSTSIYSRHNRILGDATGEMGPFFAKEDPDGQKRVKSSWYESHAYFLYNQAGWFGRGGSYEYGSSAGIMAFGPNVGDSDNGIKHAFRVVLTP